MTFKDFFINNKKVKELYVNSKKVKIGEPIPENMLGFKAVDGAVGLSLTKQGEPDPISLETNLDGSGWTAWDLLEITIPEGKTLYVRRTDDNPNNTFSKSSSSVYKFVTTGTGKVEAQGNIQYLLGKSGNRTDVPTYCYRNTFRDCTSLTKAPELPATTLNLYCYESIFNGCTSLTEAPELPATTLVDYCYSNMFANCTSLTKAPELPATTLIGHCYASMFANCTSLNSLKVAFTTWAPNLWYTQLWLMNTSSTGTFTCPQALIDATTTRGTSTVPAGWNMVAI